MSSNLSKINRVVSEPESYSEQIQLNEIMQYSLQRLQQQKKNLDIIVRCQSLPTIEADKKNIVKVFDHLVQMIVSYPPTGTRLFLYVDC
jgi:signal transduction histidine kinase